MRREHQNTVSDVENHNTNELLQCHGESQVQVKATFYCVLFQKHLLEDTHGIIVQIRLCDTKDFM